MSENKNKELSTLLIVKDTQEAENKINILKNQTILKIKDVINSNMSINTKIELSSQLIKDLNLKINNIQSELCDLLLK